MLILVWIFLHTLCPPTAAGQWSDGSQLLYYPSDRLSIRDYTDARLTDVVIPFHQSQVDKAEALILQWNEYPPCSLTSTQSNMNAKDLSMNPKDLSMNPKDLSMTAEELAMHEAVKQISLHHKHPICDQLGLIFLVTGDRVQSIERVLLRAVSSLAPHIRRHFADVRIVFIKLRKRENGYLRGSRLMFEYMLTNGLGLRDPYYVMYLEPDARPVRPGWLAVLDASTRWPNHPFWMKGSCFRGDPRAFTHSPWNMLHINGNALYNLRDDLFQRFYFDHVLRAHNRSLGTVPYDHMFYRYLTDVAYYQISRAVGAKFQYTDYIHNVWYTTISLRKYLDHYRTVYLIHGANFTE